MPFAKASFFCMKWPLKANELGRVGALELQHSKCCQLHLKLQVQQCTAAAAATGAVELCSVSARF